jgi:hypothetical protein
LDFEYKHLDSLMSSEQLPSAVFASRFPFRPTESQARFFRQMDVFMGHHSREPGAYDCFVLKGYAGTGKTTLISALVNLPELSATGRY